jgi:hypothetical protein
VVNEKAKSDCMLLPGTSFTPVVIVAETVEAFGRGTVGVNWAVRVAALYETAPGINAPSDVLRKKVAVVMVAGSIGSLNTAVTLDESDMAVAAAAGFVEATVGGVTSGTVSVAAADSEDNSDTTPSCPFADTRYL